MTRITRYTKKNKKTPHLTLLDRLPDRPDRGRMVPYYPSVHRQQTPRAPSPLRGTVENNLTDRLNLGNQRDETYTGFRFLFSFSKCN